MLEKEFLKIKSNKQKIGCLVKLTLTCYKHVKVNFMTHVETI